MGNDIFHRSLDSFLHQVFSIQLTGLGIGDNGRYFDQRYDMFWFQYRW